MVSPEFSRGSAFNVVRPCLISNTEHSINSSDFHSYDLQFDRRNQNNCIQLSNVPPHSQHMGEFSRSTDPIHARRPEDPEVGRGHLMNCQGDKEDDWHGFIFGRGSGLSLTLGSCLNCDVASPCLFKQKQENVVCSDPVVTREDLNQSHNQSAKHRRSDYMLCEGKATASSSDYRSNYSNPGSNHIASFSNALQNSPYLKPAQELLDEVVCVNNAIEQNSEEQFGRRRFAGMTDCSVGGFLASGDRMKDYRGNTSWTNHWSSQEKDETRIRINKLVSLLNELESRYERYLQQLGQVISSFEAVAGLGGTASYTVLMIQAMSRHFANLRDAIIIQIHASRECSLEVPGTQCVPSHQRSTGKSTKQKRENLPKLRMIQLHEVWRPLRGLPEDSVVVLRAWLFEHFLHPYPDDDEKLMLASRTGLTRNQISNWFINARVRLWKPMIEEMYKQEFAEDSEISAPSSS